MGEVEAGRMARETMNPTLTLLQVDRVGAIRMFQRDAEMKNIVLADATARDHAIRHFFGRALREAREEHRPS
jgi:hypothetical protein